MKEQIKKLWQMCFADSEAFTDLYFRLRYKEDINIAIYDQGNPVSALQMIPYPMTFFGKHWKTSYVSGACTHPDHRSRGVMRQLLNNTFHKLQADGVHLSTLIPAEPWLFDYYQSVGYAPVFNYSTEDIHISPSESTSDIEIKRISHFDEAVYHYFNQKQQERNCTILHTVEDFKVILADLTLASSGVYVAFKDKQIVGLSIAYDRDCFIEINELMNEDETIATALYTRIQQDFPDKKMIHYVRTSDSTSSHRLGMARIICAQTVLQDYATAFPSLDWRINVVDKLIVENNHCYQLKKGVCTIIPSDETTDFETIAISDLSQKLFAPLHPYMNLMLN